MHGSRWLVANDDWDSLELMIVSLFKITGIKTTECIKKREIPSCQGQSIER